MAKQAEYKLTCYSLEDENLIRDWSENGIVCIMVRFEKVLF